MKLNVEGYSSFDTSVRIVSMIWAITVVIMVLLNTKNHKTRFYVEYIRVTIVQYLGNTYCSQTYKHIQLSADSEHFFCFTEELKSDLGKNVSYPTWYETSIVILNDNP